MSTIKVAKPGYNAMTDTNPQHFYFNSDYNTFKFLEMLPSFSLTVINDGGTAQNSTAIVTVSTPLPSLGYIPYISTTIMSNGTFLGYNSGVSPSSNAAWAWAYIDPTTNLLWGAYAYDNTGTSTTTIIFYPYLFANPV